METQRPGTTDHWDARVQQVQEVYMIWFADSKFIVVWPQTLGVQWKECGLVKSNIWPRRLMLHIASRVCRRYGFSLHFTGQYLLDVLASVNTAVHTQPAVLYEICCVSVMTQHRAGQVVIKILFPERFLMSSLSLTLNLFPEAL